jgi:hypothetical protein
MSGLIPLLSRYRRHAADTAREHASKAREPGFVRAWIQISALRKDAAAAAKNGRRHGFAYFGDAD